MDPEKIPAVENLKTLLEVIAAHDAASLARGKDLGAINFSAGQPLFAQSIELATEFLSLPFDLLPLVTLKELFKPTQNLVTHLKQVADFTLVGQSSPETQRDSHLQQVRVHHDQFFALVTRHIPYLSLKSAQVQQTIKRSAALLANQQKQGEQNLKEMEEKNKEVDSIVRAARASAAKIGVAHFATSFEEIAKTHLEAGKNWMRVTIGVGIATIGVALSFMYTFPATADIQDPSTIQRIITKLVILSIFYFAVVWSARNYRTHRHLCVLNQHRQNSLKTFETFVKGAGNDDQVKNAVLLEATHCIFSPGSTGYLEGEEETPSNRIIEILKTVSSGPPAKQN